MTDHAELRRLAEACDVSRCADEGEERRRLHDFYDCIEPELILSMLNEIAENDSVVAVWRGRTQRTEEERDRLKAENERLLDELTACTEHPGGCGYWREAAKRRAEERDRLRDENEVLRRFAAEAYQVLGALDAPENVLDNASDAANGLPLRHETLLPFFAEDYEALRNDAARYRWLRERDLETIRQGGVFAGMTPENIVLNQEDLDAAIDAALEGATQ
ncbi:ead/Ea22-like family protein [Pseudomonas aeruginosa]|uniref:ead/Ea22-like family protein n=1 Tax=Pseudomonas aeruginosa TaxID=287 RepID=UPI00106BC8A9|nr:ead/Ea22-like family protein [Pseudomonas aeruginosa]